MWERQAAATPWDHHSVFLAQSLSDVGPHSSVESNNQMMMLKAGESLSFQVPCVGAESWPLGAPGASAANASGMAARRPVHSRGLLFTVYRERVF